MVQCDCAERDGTVGAERRDPQASLGWAQGHWGLRGELGRTSRNKYHFAKGIGVYLAREKRSRRKACRWVWGRRSRATQGVPSPAGQPRGTAEWQSCHSGSSAGLRGPGQQGPPKGWHLRSSGIQSYCHDYPPSPNSGAGNEGWDVAEPNRNQSCQNPKPELLEASWHQVFVRRVESDRIPIHQGGPSDHLGT